MLSTVEPQRQAHNGGNYEKWETFKVDGWDQDRIQVVAKVSAWDSTKADEEELLSKVEITAKNGLIKAEGPKTRGKRGFSVSFKVMVPNRSNLEQSKR